MKWYHLFKYEDSNPEYVLLTKHEKSGEYRIMFSGNSMREISSQIECALLKAKVDLSVGESLDNILNWASDEENLALAKRITDAFSKFKYMKK